MLHISTTFNSVMLSTTVLPRHFQSSPTFIVKKRWTPSTVYDEQAIARSPTTMLWTLWWCPLHRYMVRHAMLVWSLSFAPRAHAHNSQVRMRIEAFQLWSGRAEQLAGAQLVSKLLHRCLNLLTSDHMMSPPCSRVSRGPTVPKRPRIESE